MVTPTADNKISNFSALKDSNFRLYFFGQLVSVSGTWMQNLAQGYVVFKLTQSEAWLGIVACAAGLPILLLSPVAGVIVERVPRRTLMFCTQIAQMCLAFVLAFLTFTETLQVWHIVLMALLLGTTNALDMPARQTFVLEIVGSDNLRSGIALNSILNSSSRVLGPVAAGFALVKVGAAWCFFLNGLSFLAVIASLWFMRVPYAIRATRSIQPLKQLREGLAFVRQDTLIFQLLLLATVGGIFIVPVIQLLPSFADTVLKSPQDGYAALMAGQGVGSVMAGASVGWLSNRFGYPQLMTVSIVLSTVTTFILGLQVTIPWAFVACLLSGFFMIMQFICINTVIQLTVPNEYRGRVLALYTLSFTGLAPFGSLLLGFVANIISTSWALMAWAVLGGIINGAILITYAKKR